MERVLLFHIGITKELSHFGPMEMELELKKWMRTVISLSGAQVKKTSTKKLNNLGLDLVMKEIRSQELVHILVITTTLK